MTICTLLKDRKLGFDQYNFWSDIERCIMFALERITILLLFNLAKYITKHDNTSSVI